ncbi:hypothetical protein MLD38_010559 [Melastoma candidum]|uniref:Uncharacterized protein n=1 Tax=Melastoma candidum TaxID=119954 RepID=A0ACB9R0C5_9MYRT|nr:hypothetical protein MLD38_010559 [Melastoma candidum]
MATVNNYPFHHPTTSPPDIPLSSSTPSPSPSRAATLIQSAYRGHVVRILFRTICSVDSRASLLQGSIQRQDTVDAIRSNEKERLRLNEELMGLLLTLDGVRGMDEGIRAARRKASRRIVGLQEIVDGVSESRLLGGEGDYCCWWGEVDAMEEETCRERGGDEMVEFCSAYLGFRCLQRFLHDA